MALTLHGTVSDNTVALDRKTATPLIINGDMQIAQRGTSFTNVDNTFCVDRFKFRASGAGSGDLTQSTTVPTGQGFNNSFKIDCNTAQDPISSGEVYVEQVIEAQNLQMLKYGTSSAETTTLSFWVRSNKTGDYGIWIYQEDGNRAISTGYSISSANTWEKKVVTFAGDTGGTINNDNGRGFLIRWYLGGASNIVGTLTDSWGTDLLKRVPTGGVNIQDNTANEWLITGVQLEVGEFDANSIPPFQFEDRGTSLARCQRYFYKFNSVIRGNGADSSNNVHIGNMCYPSEMRADPTLDVTTSATFIADRGDKQVFCVYADTAYATVSAGATADAEL